MNEFTTAKLLLPDKLNFLRMPKATVGTFADGRLKYDNKPIPITRWRN